MPNAAVNRLGNRRFRARWTQLQRSMRSPRVVVRGIHGKRPAEMSLAEDQHAVGDLGADGQHESLGEAVRPRAPRRDLDHFDARIGQHGIERCRELSRSIANEEPEPGDMVTEVHDEVLGLLCRPGPIGMPSHAQHGR